MPNHKPHYLARIPTMLLLFLLAILPELAIVLFILRHIDRKAERREQAEDAVRWQTFGTAPPRPGEYGYRAANPAPARQEDEGVDPPSDEQKKARERQEKLITLCTIAGGILALVGFVSLGDTLDTIRWIGLDLDLFLDELLPAAAQLIGGGGMLAWGALIRRTRKLEKQLDRVVGDRDNIPLDELFATAGIAPDKGRSALENAIEHGYFGADAYIDNRTRTLIVRGPAPEPAQPKPQPAPAPAAETEAQRMLRELREVNDAIADPVISLKITRLEHVTGRIFELAEKDPDKKPRLQKFTEYYLPTSLRLLNTYAQLEHQPAQGQNILEARRSIENSMDMLVTAFENQLDKLFQSDALDVTADIAALQGMLNMDGLTGMDDFGPQTGQPR